MKINLNPMPKLRSFVSDSRRILSVSYKPTNEAFKRTLKIILLGILILGVMSFVIAGLVGFLAS